MCPCIKGTTDIGPQNKIHPIVMTLLNAINENRITRLIGLRPFRDKICPCHYITPAVLTGSGSVVNVRIIGLHHINGSRIHNGRIRMQRLLPVHYYFPLLQLFIATLLIKNRASRMNIHTISSGVSRLLTRLPLTRHHTIVTIIPRARAKRMHNHKMSNLLWYNNNILHEMRVCNVSLVMTYTTTYYLL